VPGESNVIAIGANPSTLLNYTATFIGGIYDAVIADRAVYIGVDGKLRTLASSRRYKEQITPMDKASETLFALKPVTFRYKQEIDPSHKLSFGLIAEDVAEINANLVSWDRDGKPQTVRYEAVNAMLLNEFLKEHKKVEEQQANIAELKSIVAQQQKGMEVLMTQLKDQAAQIQKVSAQFEINKPKAKVVVNKP